MNRPELSIVIPFKDEEKRLPESLKTILEFADKHLKSFELILVDDGSVDGSRDVTARYLTDNRVKLLIHKTNQGKGAAVRTGVLAATGKLILFTDADLATPIEQIDKLIKALNDNKADIIIGSRALPGSVVTAPQPFYRVVIGKTGNVLIRLITGLPYKDTQCGFKLFTTKAARVLFQDQQFPRWSFDIEVLYKAKLDGYKVIEVPISWHDVPGSKVNGLVDSVQVLLDVFRIIKIHHKH